LVESVGEVVWVSEVEEEETVVVAVVAVVV
jgi:hypothetical protein